MAAGGGDVPAAAGKVALLEQEHEEKLRQWEAEEAARSSG